MPPRRHSSLHLKPCPPWSLNLADLHHQWGLFSQSGIFLSRRVSTYPILPKTSLIIMCKDLNYSGWRTQLYIYVGTSNFHAATKLIEKVHNSLNFATLRFSEPHPAMFPIVMHIRSWWFPCASRFSEQRSHFHGIYMQKIATSSCNTDMLYNETLVCKVNVTYQGFTTLLCYAIFTYKPSFGSEAGFILSFVFQGYL